MPRLIHRNPRYAKHRASGQAIVELDGKTFYLGAYNSRASRDEYDRLIALWLANGRRLVVDAGSDLTIAELIDRYWSHVQRYYRRPDGSQTDEVHSIRQALPALNRLYGDTLARNFGPADLKAIRIEAAKPKTVALGGTGKTYTTRGWCRATINKHAKHIRAMFRWGVSEGMIAPDVLVALQAVAPLKAGRCDARESDPVRPVPDDIVDSTLPHLSATVAAMVKLQRLTGARPAEICNLRIGDIDRSSDVWTATLSQHKTSHHGHDRTLHFGAKAQAVLLPFLNRIDAAAYVFDPRRSEAERREQMHAKRRTPMSCGNVPGSNVVSKPKVKPGDCYDVASYRRAIHRATDKAAVERWSPHRLRHTTATELRKKFGIEAARCILGHTRISTTELYAEQNREAARKVAQLIG